MIVAVKFYVPGGVNAYGSEKLHGKSTINPATNEVTRNSSYDVIAIYLLYVTDIIIIQQPMTSQLIAEKDLHDHVPLFYVGLANRFLRLFLQRTYIFKSYLGLSL